MSNFSPLNKTLFLEGNSSGSREKGPGSSFEVPDIKQIVTSEKPKDETSSYIAPAKIFTIPKDVTDAGIKETMYEEPITIYGIPKESIDKLSKESTAWGKTWLATMARKLLGPKLIKSPKR